MKRNERAATRRLLAAWYQVQAQANHVAVEADDLELLQGLAEVRDYVAARIEECEARLICTPENAQFATLGNRGNNASAKGLDNVF